MGKLLLTLLPALLGAASQAAPHAAEKNKHSLESILSLVLWSFALSCLAIFSVMQLFGLLNERVLREPNGPIILALVYSSVALGSSLALYFIASSRRRKDEVVVKEAPTQAPIAEGIAVNLVGGFMSGLQKAHLKSAVPGAAKAVRNEVSYTESSDQSRFPSPSYPARPDFFLRRNQYID